MPIDSQRAHADVSTQPTSPRAPWTLSRSRAGAAAVLVLIAVGFGLGLIACHAHGAADGAGGQSGDEGFKPGTTWLGTGGVAADLPALVQ